MSFAKTMVAAVLLALWAPLSMHCTLEAVSGLELIGCCFTGESEPHRDNGCADDGCEDVESGQYLAAQREVEVSAPILLLAFDLSSLTDHKSVGSSSTLDSVPAAPPELAVTWQFVLRAAASPRAPSLLA